jgi:carbamate kinase
MNPAAWRERPLLVVALGGNALLPAGSRGALEDQWRAARRAAEQLARLLESGPQLLVTHGNGPQVGLALSRAARAEPELPALSMDVAVAHTQGELGYALARALADALAPRGLDRAVLALVTQTLVAADDPAFEQPDKPIGAFVTAAEAESLKEERGWDFARLAPGPRAWRRVVASPRPLEVVELPGIRGALDAGNVVIAAGGGGIPVRRQRDLLAGVEAVVDKDRVSALLAAQLGAELLIIATSVPQVALGYGTAAARWLDRMRLSEARGYLAAGEFAAGSMGPKVEAAADFVAAGGARAVIADLDHLVEAWQGQAGTEIVAD